MSTTNNGVILENIQNLVDAVKENPGLANVTFKAKSQWLGGTKAEVSISELEAGGQNIAREGRDFKLVVDEPPELGGTDEAPNPVEHVLGGLCGCLTAGIATNAALFETPLDKIEVEVQANWDLHGVLGLNRDVPNGALNLHYKVNLKGEGDKEKIQRSKETLDRKSPIRNTLELPLKITTEINIED